MSKQVLALLTIVLTLSGCSDEALVGTEIENATSASSTAFTAEVLSKGPVSVSHSELHAFLAAGPAGTSGVLTEGAFSLPQRAVSRP